MESTDQLKADHRVIEKVLDFLKAVAVAARQGKQLPVDSLEQAVGFIRDFADRCHHGKEEGVLFEELIQGGLPRESGPVAAMLDEHDQGRAFVQQMGGALERYRQGDGGAALEVAEAAQGYADLLSQHIWKEENILYSMADQALAGKDQRMVEAFEEAEELSVGRDGHHRLMELADRLGEQAGKLASG